MFEQRPLSGELDELRDEHAPGTLVLDVERDFETLPSAVAESLLAVVDAVAVAIRGYPGRVTRVIARVAG